MRFVVFVAITKASEAYLTVHGFAFDTRFSEAFAALAVLFFVLDILEWGVNIHTKLTKGDD